jgi:glycosyltransferase involved in cell wall biosynthesis
MKIKVLFESQPLIGEKTGIGRYVDKLTSSIDQQSDVELFFWYNQLINNSKINTDQIKTINNRYPYKVIRRIGKQLKFFHEVPVDVGLKFDIFHAGNFITYNTSKAKNIITIHDLAFLKYPDVTDDKTYKHHTTWLPYSIERADHIIAVSNQTKDDIISFYKVPEDKISITYLATDCSINQSNLKDFNIIKDRYQLPNQYLLYVGTLEPRKNIPYMLEAYSIAKRKYQIPHKLVIVGKKGWKYESIFQTIERNKLENDIIFTGFVKDEDLPVIYSGARVFLFPSIYEGFGLPVLEAMKCGLPVITTNISSLPEVAGDAGILIPLDDVSYFADQIFELVNDDEKWKHYSQLSLNRASQFSWDRTALETIDVYKKVLKW